MTQKTYLGLSGDERVRRDGGAIAMSNARAKTINLLLYEGELIVLHIPANSLADEKEDSNGVWIRADRDLLDLYINTDTFFDRKSGTNFSRFIIAKEKY